MDVPEGDKDDKEKDNEDSDEVFLEKTSDVTGEMLRNKNQRKECTLRKRRHTWSDRTMNVSEDTEKVVGVNENAQNDKK